MIDFLRRVKNMAYTTAENYDINVKMDDEANTCTDTKNVTVTSAEFFMKQGLSEAEALAVITHGAAHEGAHVKLSDISAIDTLVERMKKDKIANADLLMGMVQTAEDYRIDSTMAKERPGYWVNREKTVDATTKLFKDAPSGNVNFDTMKAVAFDHYGVDLSTFPAWSGAGLDWGRIKSISENLKSIALKSKSSAEIMDNVYNYYMKEHDDGQRIDYPGHPTKKGDFGKATSEKGKGSDINVAVSSNDDAGKGSDEGAEGTEDGGKTDENSDTKSDEKSDGTPDSSGSAEKDAKAEAKALEKKVRNDLKKILLGKSSVIDDLVGEDMTDDLEREITYSSRSEVTIREYVKSSDSALAYYKVCMNLEPLWSAKDEVIVKNTICKGIHAGTRVFYGKNRRKDEPLGYSDLSGEEKRKLDVAAKNMGSKLLQELRADADPQGEIAQSGRKVISNKMWKPVHTGSKDVFYKPQNIESGGYVVDLLLDASGSQDGRTKNIRKQAYIIAEACSIAGIPCRVTSFHVRGCVTVLKCFRLYDDPRKENVQCFRYEAQGDNRDGLAIEAANYELQKRPEQNKIFIILSDGAPHDGSAGMEVEGVGGMAYYMGADETVLKDVYDRVKRIRDSGTAVMAVYVGYQSHLPMEKLMYGNDFAYIRDMDGFVPNVMQYLVKHIQKLQ